MSSSGNNDNIIVIVIKKKNVRVRGRGIKSRVSRTTSKRPWRSSLRSTLIYDFLSNLLFLSHA